MKLVTSAFTAVMSDVAYILRDETTDSSLKLLALDPWILQFSASDHLLLHSVDIFHTVHRLMLIDSLRDFGVSTTMGTRSRGSVGTHRNPLLGDSDLRKYEKAAREKLRKTAKKVFRLLGVICMAPNKEDGIKSEKGIYICGPIRSNDLSPGDALQQSFFSLMATQLEIAASQLARIESENESLRLFLNSNVDVGRGRSNSMASVRLNRGSYVPMR